MSCMCVWTSEESGKTVTYALHLSTHWVSRLLPNASLFCLEKQQSRDFERARKVGTLKLRHFAGLKCMKLCFEHKNRKTRNCKQFSLFWCILTQRNLPTGSVVLNDGDYESSIILTLYLTDMSINADELLINYQFCHLLSDRAENLADSDFRWCWLWI